MNYSTTQNNFSSGYLDPLLHGMVGTDAYNYGLRKCLNFIPDGRGFLFKRPGTRFYGTSILGEYARIRTVRSVDGILTIIFSDHAIHILLNGITIFSIESPYSNDDLKKLNIAMNGNDVYLVHPDIRPYVLAAESTVGVSIHELKDVGDAEYEVKEAAEDTLSASNAILSGVWSLTPVEFIGDVKFSTLGWHPSCQAFKGGRWYLSGIKNEPGVVYASRPVAADGTTRFNDFTMQEEYLIKSEHTLTRQVDYVSAGSSEIASSDYRTEDRNSSEPYDPTEAIPEDSSSTVFKMYKLQNGTYVETTLDSERIRTIETSTQITYQVNTSVQPDHAIRLQETDLYGSSYNWLISQQRLIAGARRSIWIDTGAAATPESFDMMNTLASSTSTVQPAAYSNYVFFTTSDRRSIKAAYFDNDSGGYMLLDISQKAISLFTSPIKEIEVAEGYVDLLWVLLEDGRLLSCTLSGGMFGWAEHRIGGGGKVVSIYSYTEDDEADILFLIVDRGHVDEEGQGILYVETLEFEDLVHSETFTCLDGAVDIASISADGFADLSDVNAHEFLEGDVLQLVADNWAQTDFEYSERIAVDKTDASRVYVGFPMESCVELMRPEYNSQETGVSLGKKRRAVESKLLLYRSGCGIFEYDDEDGRLKGFEFQQLLKTGVTVTGDDAGYFTGLVTLSLQSYVTGTGFIRIRTDKPLPLTIQAVITKWDLQEV